MMPWKTIGLHYWVNLHRPTNEAVVKRDKLTPPPPASTPSPPNFPSISMRNYQVGIQLQWEKWIPEQTVYDSVMVGGSRLGIEEDYVARVTWFTNSCSIYI